MAKDIYFLEEKRKRWMSIKSLSGKYILSIDSFAQEKGWAYTQGDVCKTENSQITIATINRNYPSFPHVFIEDHPNGHDYLICGEDYQGQTVIELDTGERRDYLPENAAKGWGFCWSEYKHSPDKIKLAVLGCYWGAPYDLIVYDCSNPMDLPYKKIIDFPDENQNSYQDFGWIDDNNLIIEVIMLKSNDDIDDQDTYRKYKFNIQNNNIELIEEYKT